MSKLQTKKWRQNFSKGYCRQIRNHRTKDIYKFVDNYALCRDSIIDNRERNPKSWYQFQSINGLMLNSQQNAEREKKKWAMIKCQPTTK